MGLEAVLWTLAATFFSGLQVFFQKVVAQEKRGAALNGAFMYGLSGVAAFLALFYYDVPNAWVWVSLYAIAGGVVHAIGNYVRIEGLKHIDSVIFFPLNKVLGPLVVLVGSVFILDEHLTQLQLVGVIVSMCVPLLLISTSERHRQQNLALGLVFLVVSTVLTSISQILTKLGVGLDPAVFFMMGVSQLAGFVSSGVMHTRSTETISALKDRRDWELGLIAGLLAFVSFYALLKAMSLGQLSIVYTIHAHYILIPIILSVWWYGEHINARKLLAVCISFVAIGLLI